MAACKDRSAQGEIRSTDLGRKYMYRAASTPSVQVDETGHIDGGPSMVLMALSG